MEVVFRQNPKTCGAKITLEKILSTLFLCSHKTLGIHRKKGCRGSVCIVSAVPPLLWVAEELLLGLPCSTTNAAQERGS